MPPAWTLLINAGILPTLKYMCAAKKAKSNVPPVCYNGEILERVTHFTFSSSNNFNNRLKEVAKQTYRSQAVLDQHVLRHPLVTPMHVFELFDSLLMSKLTYGCVVCGAGKYVSFEQFHTKFLIKTLQVKCNTNTSVVYAETGRYPLTVTINYQIIKYWLKILTSPDSLHRINEDPGEASMDQSCEASVMSMWIQ